MPLERSQVCESAAAKLAAALPRLHALRALVGLDGFVDEIVEVVDKRHDVEKYDAVRTIDSMGRKILAAAGQSSNYELVVKRTKIGGSGPIMAGALAAAGMGVTCIGCLGKPEIHPIFGGFTHPISVGEPGYTQALEFEDGKLMLNKTGGLPEVSWERIVDEVGEEELGEIVGACGLIAMNNWTMIPHMARIWEGFGGILAGLPRRDFFVDLSDPEKRTERDLRIVLETLGKLEGSADVILGLNLKEAIRVAQVVGGIDESLPAGLVGMIRQKLKISCVVVHPRHGAAAASVEGLAEFDGPFVRAPGISTGAGDHFNAGFCLGRMLGMTLEECLCAGTACSGYYVRHGRSADGMELVRFMGELPDPEG